MLKTIPIPTRSNAAGQALVALGSNQAWQGAAPVTLLRDAIGGIEALALSRIRVSEFFRSPCFPAGAGPDFVNAAVALETDLAPEDLLAALHGIEAGLGRRRDRRWGARSVDLDLIAWADAVRPDATVQRAWMALPPARQAREAPEQLILPHPRMQDRGFVLRPLVQVAPDWRHPTLGRTVAQLLADLPAAALEGVVPL